MPRNTQWRARRGNGRIISFAFNLCSRYRENRQSQVTIETKAITGLNLIPILKFISNTEAIVMAIDNRF